MALVFPTSLFGFLEQEIDIERQTLKGGVAISGEQDITSTDGGGRVFADFAEGSLIDRAPTLAWRALQGILEEGVTPIIVPFCDIRHQPYGGEYRVTHSDGTSFSDDTLYAGGGPMARATADAALRATYLSISAQMAQPLIGGEWFTVVHPNKQERAYKVKSLEGQTGIRFVPPLREALTSGTTLDFRDPRCLMVQDGRASTRKSGRMTPAAIRFVEAP
jgi:hypothetical protein